ncbi:730_t:CDS:2 [Paraglomus occultum]|uniref:730_t:CDS:1 n=1 Tax=Paraglomus occultum TaxID=144539 RepID=A0A9N9F8U4_9GLOM|nr:730_t:CDS:2 [Paraglomus occultum]
MALDPKTPADYAFHILFTHFTVTAERKLSNIMGYTLDHDPDLSGIVGPGVDPAFDKLLNSLGYIARHKPTHIMDSFMQWRKDNMQADGNSLSTHRDRILHDRKIQTTLFILCRALIEIVNQVQPEALPEGHGTGLEEIAFVQLSRMEPDDVMRSRSRRASSDLFAELIGALSNIRFATVSDRFIVKLGELTRAPLRDEARICYIINGMRFLKLKIYPVEALDETADFLLHLADSLRQTNADRIVQAYAKVFVQLLLPLAGVADAEVNFPAWVRAVELLWKKTHKILVDKRRVEISYPLATTLLCVSQKDFFSHNWMNIVDHCIARFKDKHRNMAMNCINRLLWTFIYRCPESLSTTHKRIEHISRVLFPRNRGALPEINHDLLVQFIYFVGVKHYDYCMTNILMKLMNNEALMSNSSLDCIHPDRMKIAICSFVALLAAIELQEWRPPFPKETDLVNVKRESTGVKYSANLLPDDVFNRAGLKAHFEHFCDLSYRMMSILDKIFGKMSVLEEKYQISRPPYFPPNNPNGKVISLPGENGIMIHSYKTLTVAYQRDKQVYMDLMTTYIDSLPRLLPASSKLPTLVEMLSRYVVHVDPELAAAAARALRRIAAQCGAEYVIMGLSRFVYKIEDKYVEMLACSGSDSGRAILKLYLDMLYVWLRQLKAHNQSVQEEDVNASSDNVSKAPSDLEDSAVLTVIEETEANGLLFLCSQEPIIRKDAVRILQVVAELELELEIKVAREKGYSRHSTIVGIDGQSMNAQSSLDNVTLVGENLHGYDEHNEHNRLRYSANAHEKKIQYKRIIHILTRGGRDLIKFDKDDAALHVRESVQLLKLKEEGTKDILLKLVQSSEAEYLPLWTRVFPEFMKLCFDHFAVTVALCRNNVCSRIVSMQQAIISAAEPVTRTPAPTLRMHLPPKVAPATDEMIGQWRLYLIVACSTITLTDEYVDRIWTPSRRRADVTPPDRITSARVLFRMVLRLLSSERQLIRDAVVTALGNINENVYKVLLEDMQQYQDKIAEESRRNVQRGYTGTYKRSRKYERLRTELAHVYQLTAHFLLKEEFIHDPEVQTMTKTYVEDTFTFLREPEITNDWEWRRLRTYLCGLVEKLYDASQQEKVDIISEKLRVDLFRMFEEWCGHGTKNADHARIRMQFEADHRPVQQMEAERKSLELAALNAMASLCRGPVICAESQTGGGSRNRGLEMSNLLKWIETVFADPQDRLHPIARRALEGMLVYNANNLAVLERTINLCYSRRPELKSTQGYFMTVANTLFQLDPSKTPPVSKVLALALFKVGDPDLEIRRTAMKLLKLVQTSFYNESVDEFQVGITSTVPSIYKSSQIDLSGRLAQCARKHDNERRKKAPANDTASENASAEDLLMASDETYLMLSEMAKLFESVSEKSQRDMLGYMLPWLRNIEFVMTDGKLYLTTYMVLSNLFYITVKYGDIFVKEVELLWQQLVAGENMKNVCAIVNYFITIGMEKRNPNFVTHAKRVFVYLGRTPACMVLIETLMAEISPTAMLPSQDDNSTSQTTKDNSSQQEESSSTAEQREDTSVKSPIDSSFRRQISEVGLFCATIDDALPGHHKPPVFSSSQLAMMYMVDMAIEAGGDLKVHLPLLIHVIFVQLDALQSTISEEARAFLINLIHSNVISKSFYSDAVRFATRLVAELNAKTSPRLWKYEDITYKNRNIKSLSDLEALCHDVLNVFRDRGTGTTIKQKWGEIALKWATNCTVRHVACRSFQIFRALRPDFNELMLADIVHRLSNTIADTHEEVQGFALETLITLSYIVDWLPLDTKTLFPQITWTMIACLQTSNEPEYLEALTILNKLMDKFDFNDNENRSLLWSFFPGPKWSGVFEGIQPLLIKGIQSSHSVAPTFRMMKKLLLLEEEQLVDPTPTRLLFLLLANIPRLVHAFDVPSTVEECREWAQNISVIATKENKDNIAKVMFSYSKGRFRTKDDFIKQAVVVIKDNYIPQFQVKILLFLMSLLWNKIPYYKLKTMKIIKMLLPHIDTQQPDFIEIGAEVIMPLLRLLSTQYAQSALEVLDEAISISGGPKDKYILRMSGIAGRRSSNRDTKNEASRFGEPSETGWSVPDLAKTQELTRSNVRSVCYTCAIAPDNAHYFGGFSSEMPVIHPDEMSNDCIPASDYQFREIVNELQTLKDFWGDDGSLSANSIDAGRSMTMTSLQIPSIIEENITDPEYEERIEATWEKSLSKSSSVTSFSTYVDAFTDSSVFGIPQMPRRSDNNRQMTLTQSSSYSSTDEEADMERVYDDSESIISEGNNESFQLEGILSKSRYSPARRGSKQSQGTPYGVEPPTPQPSLASVHSHSHSHSSHGSISSSSHHTSPSN